MKYVQIQMVPEIFFILITESQKTVYLSSQVGSLHNDETDESWLDSVLGGTSIFTDKNKIYIVKRGKPEFFDEFGERGRSYLLQLNKDGSGRKELTPFL